MTGPVVLCGLDGREPAPALTIGDALALLDRAETSRWRTLRRPEDRDSFAMAHAALRALVGARLGVDPRDVPLVTPRDERPRVEMPDAEVFVSLSRRPAAVAVVAHDRPVGIDVEILPLGVDVVHVARRFLPAHEVESVLSSTDADERFARLWVRKEALGKALGLTLEQALAVSVGDVGADGQPQEIHVPGVDGHVVRVRLVGFSAPRGIVGASAEVVSH